MTDEEFAELPVSIQQAVARGEVTIEELIERAAASVNAELCPRCGYHKVSPLYAGLGLCLSCARTEMTDAHMQRLSELEVARDSARLRKKVQRVRDELDPDRPRGANGASKKKSADYGRASIIGTDDDLKKCECDKTFRQHSDNDVLCPGCTENANRDDMRSV